MPVQKYITRALWFLIVVAFAAGLSAGKPQNTSAEKIKKALNAFIADADLKHAGVGFYIADDGTGNPLHHNAELTLIPASVQKIVTTGAALDILGADFTFKTQMAYNGEIDSAGTLNGNIYIIGGGDPTLGSDRVKGSADMDDVLKNFAQAVKNKGIKKISGNILLDLNFFDNSLPDNWAWNDIGNYYGAGAYSLSFNENQYFIYLDAPAKTGADVEIVKYSYEIPGLKIHNLLKAGAANSGDNAYIFGAPYNYTHVLKGTIPAGKKNFRIKGSLPDPPLFFAQQLAKAFFEHGIYVNFQPQANPHAHVEADDLKLTVLHTITSPALKDIINHTNLSSVNLYAEHLLKACGRKMYNEGSTEAGIKAIINSWKNKGVDVEALFMYDGSGLSHYNGINAKQLVQMLSAMQNEPYFKDFYNSLPVAGISGAMRNMGTETTIENKMHAKTGHMERIRSYAGYIEKPGVKPVPFALIVNNYTCPAWEIKAKIEKLLVALGG